MTAPSRRRAGQALVASGTALEPGQVAIVDPRDRAPLRPGEVGEIVVAGESVADGYCGRPDLTREVFGGGTLRTGDLGFLDPEGRLFVTGRLKDLIVVRGRNVYPQDLEATAERAHPALRPEAAAAFAIDADGEERVVLVAELDRPRRDTDVDAIVAAVRRAIADEHDVPVQAVILVEPGRVPRTSSRRSSGGRAASCTGAASWRSSGPACSRTTLGPRRPSTGCPSTRSRRPDVGRRCEISSWRGSGTPCGRRWIPARRFAASGVDSLAAVELQHALERELGVEVAVTGDLTVDELVDRILALRDVERPEERDHPPRTPPGSAPCGSPTDGSGIRSRTGLPGRSGSRVRWTWIVCAPRSSPWWTVTRRSGPRWSRWTASRRSGPAGRGRSSGWRPAAGPTTQCGSCWRSGASGRSSERGPVVRFTVVERARDLVLLVVVHHLVADLWSLIVWSAISAPCTATARCRRSVRRRWSPSRTGGVAAFWMGARRGRAGARPADRLAAPAASLHRAGVVRFALDAGTTGAVERLAREATPPRSRCGWRCSRSSSAGGAVRPTCWSGRRSPDGRERRWPIRVGYHVDPVVLRGELGGGPTFRALLERTRDRTRAAFAHRDLPFAELVERLGDRDPSRAPLVQVMFGLLEAPRIGLDPTGLAGLVLGERSGRIRGRWARARVVRARSRRGPRSTWICSCPPAPTGSTGP